MHLWESWVIKQHWLWNTDFSTYSYSRLLSHINKRFGPVDMEVKIKGVEHYNDPQSSCLELTSVNVCNLPKTYSNLFLT